MFETLGRVFVRNIENVLDGPLDLVKDLFEIEDQSRPPIVIASETTFGNINSVMYIPHCEAIFIPVQNQIPTLHAFINFAHLRSADIPETVVEDIFGGWLAEEFSHYYFDLRHDVGSHTQFNQENMIRNMAGMARMENIGKFCRESYISNTNSGHLVGLYQEYVRRVLRYTIPILVREHSQSLPSHIASYVAERIPFSSEEEARTIFRLGYQEIQNYEMRVVADSIQELEDDYARTIRGEKYEWETEYK